jgi:predicted dehydrogenase
MTRLTRRSFLRSGAIACAGASLSPSSMARVAGANGDVRIGVVGLNGKGKDHVAGFSAIPGVRVVALCDVDRTALDAAAQAAKLAGSQVETFEDYRDLLARPDIDAVSIATPNHQHAVQTIWALRAGKDVFVEKPVSHDLWEGEQLVRAARKYDRIVEAGMQNRSSPAIAQAIAWQREGHIGKVTLARGFCYKRRESIGKTVGPQPVPKGVNYDLWLGPLPLAPLRRARFHYDWHWQWATGNGDIGNQGNHQLDVARRFLGQSGAPLRVSSAGGRFGYRDDGETPNTLVVAYEYAAAPLIFEVRGLPARRAAPADPKSSAPSAAPVAAGTTPPASIMDEYRGLSVGNVIECEGGYIVVPAGDYTSARAFDSKGKPLQEWTGKASHYANFIDTVKSRKPADSNAPIVEGQLSSALSHLANLSQQLGRDVKRGAVTRAFEPQPLLAEAFVRMDQHLKLHGVDLADTSLRLGATLTLDPATERVTGEHAAAAARTMPRQYRKPFVIGDVG